jgi:hypothetical protein
MLATRRQLAIYGVPSDKWDLRERRPRAKRKTAAENAVVYRLELDLLLSFVPPMEEHARAICLTRTLELPFPPWDGLILTSEALNGRPDPMGYVLKEVTWDMDSQVFLAKTQASIHGLPIACIPYDIRDLLDLGWRYGSVADSYGTDDEQDEHVGLDTPTDEDAEDTWDDEDRLRSMPPRKRPREFNKLFRALVREMASLFNNLPTAFAMDKTKTLFTEEELKKDETPAKKRFKDAITEYYKMSSQQQGDWQDRVIRNNPRLDRIVEE